LLLATAPLDAAYRLRVSALVRLIDAIDSEIRAVVGPLRVGLTGHPAFLAIQALLGVGLVLAAIFVAEIGDVHRFADAGHL
jgi:transposase